MSLKLPFLAFALTIPAFLPSEAQAADCFILVHGNQSGNAATDPSVALNYWTSDGNFAEAVTGGTANYGIVSWNSSNSNAIPFWHPDAAGSVANQLVKIEGGQGDGYSHARQCAAGDKFYVVAHSQGAQVMTYINGNAKASDPNSNTVIAAKDLNQVSTAQRSYAPFSVAMAPVVSVISVGGAINGTEGMDDVCNGGLDAALLSLVGKTCVPSLQTYTQYNASSFTGPGLYRPMYSLGGYGTTPISLTTLTGEDDGVVNLASQMNCAGSPQRDLENDLKEWSYGMWVSFTCNSANKRHTNNFNLASINITHNKEVTAPTGDWTHKMNAAGVLACGDKKNVPATIRACLTLLR